MQTEDNTASHFAAADRKERGGEGQGKGLEGEGEGELGSKQG